MIDGPLPAKGLGAGPKYLGKPRFPWAAMWSPPTTLCFGLEGKNGFAHRYSFDGGQFTTVTRVVAATAEGTAKVIISYVLEALSTKESQMNEPWKSSVAEDAAYEVASHGDASTASYEEPFHLHLAAEPPQLSSRRSPIMAYAASSHSSRWQAHLPFRHPRQLSSRCLGNL